MNKEIWTWTWTNNSKAFKALDNILCVSCLSKICLKAFKSLYMIIINKLEKFNSLNIFWYRDKFSKKAQKKYSTLWEKAKKKSSFWKLPKENFRKKLNLIKKKSSAKISAISEKNLKKVSFSFWKLSKRWVTVTTSFPQNYIEITQYHLIFFHHLLFI
jgi:hypothetical protein